MSTGTCSQGITERECESCGPHFLGGWHAQKHGKAAAQPTRICNCFNLISDTQDALGCLWISKISLQLFLHFFFFKWITSYVLLWFFSPDGHIHPHLVSSAGGREDQHQIHWAGFDIWWCSIKKMKKVGLSRWNKSSKREKESIMPVKILIYSVMKRLSDHLNIISDVTPVLVCLKDIQ